MNKITVEMELDDWVWMCEFLADVIRQETELQPYEREDLARLYNVLTSAERAIGS